MFYWLYLMTPQHLFKQLSKWSYPKQLGVTVLQSSSVAIFLFCGVFGLYSQIYWLNTTKLDVNVINLCTNILIQYFIAFKGFLSSLQCDLWLAYAVKYFEQQTRKHGQSKAKTSIMKWISAIKVYPDAGGITHADITDNFWRNLFCIANWVGEKSERRTKPFKLLRGKESIQREWSRCGRK